MLKRKDIRRWQTLPYLTGVFGEFGEFPGTLMYDTLDGTVIEREAFYKGEIVRFGGGRCIGVGYFRIGDKTYEVDATYTKQQIQLYKFVKPIISSRGMWKKWDKDSDVVFEIDNGHGIVRGKKILTVVMNCMVEFCGPCSSIVIRRY